MKPVWCWRCARAMTDKGDVRTVKFTDTLGGRQVATLCVWCMAELQKFLNENAKEDERNDID